TDRPRRARRPASDSRHIPAEVKRAVYIRDRGLCAYASPSGHRCGERAFLEFHHVRPVAAGGTATLDNIELRCRVHNALEAELFFGASRVSEHSAEYVVSPLPRFRSGTKTADERPQLECRSSRQGSPRMW